MKQVLSQEEIDSLLKALDSGTVPSLEDGDGDEKSNIKPYDFKRPFKLSREYVDTLAMIFENFSKISSMIISNQLVSNVEIKLVAVEQISFEEFLRSVPSSTVVGTFVTSQFLSNQLIALSPQFSVQVIEMMCGGTNKKDPDDIKRSKFTDIELSILEEIIVGLLKAFKVAWEEILEIDTEITSIDSNPQMIQSISPNEPVVLVTCSAEIGKFKNFINLCIPYLSFDNIIDKLSIRNRFRYTDSGNNDYSEVLSKSLLSVPVELEVALGKSKINVEDILQLELGDLIQLDMNIKEPLKMYVEGKGYYLVKPGQVEGKIAVEVLQYLEEDVVWWMIS